METEGLEVIRFLLGIVVLGCLAYFVIRESGELEHHERRDLEREHRLGAHRETAAWGCRDCERGDP